jgi:hypothetical protein
MDVVVLCRVAEVDVFVVVEFAVVVVVVGGGVVVEKLSIVPP